jgi:hypothetical protein
MDITSLEIRSLADGSGTVQAWCKCSSPDQIDDLVAWLGLARHVMEEWHAIRDAHRHIIETGGGNVTAIKKKERATDESK